VPTKYSRCLPLSMQFDSGCRCSKIMSPPKCNETLSPSQDGDIILEHLQPAIFGLSKQLPMYMVP
jgi:hypothetical protein